ncbi:unnamed protein product [Prorocentrum cordatum]|uniref:Uncharacterized protein n=1 Tax=Prorocentrum cordatum TaxID=2364126 RepID=A0ABN9T2L7_9DINO|nr:unnamed protein product [Polarella glacialis]
MFLDSQASHSSRICPSPAGFECARRPRPIFAAAYGWVFCLANFLCPALASANQGRRHWACAKRSRRRRRTRLRRASDCCGARSRLCRAGAPRGCTAARRRSSPVEEEEEETA